MNLLVGMKLKKEIDMSDHPEIRSIKEAKAAGKLAVSLGMPLHDLTTEMNKRNIPLQFRGAWLSAVEDAAGHDGEDPNSDGYGWERAALQGT